jgi:hypothetical protein
MSVIKLTVETQFSDLTVHRHPLITIYWTLMKDDADESVYDR